MRIRPATAHDTNRIEEILRATERFTDEEVGWAMELVIDRAKRGDGSEYEIHVAETPEGRIAGYSCFGPTPRTDAVFDLYWIAVDPAFERRGVGSALLEFVEREIRRRGARLLLIETSSKASYAPTRQFYERHGYREISRIKDFYRVADDKIVFARELKQDGNDI